MAQKQNYQAIVYDDFAAHPMKATFLGNRWWVTTPGEPLQPLEKVFDDMSIGFCFLCEAGGRVGALALAKLLGRALQMPELKVLETLHNRLEDLKRLGVTLDVKDEPLTLELRVFAHQPDSFRHGKYSAWCHAVGNRFESVFDWDAFDEKKEAEEWACLYFDVLEEIGVEFKIV